MLQRYKLQQRMWVKLRRALLMVVKGSLLL
jgi:hypothetical protein